MAEIVQSLHVQRLATAPLAPMVVGFLFAPFGIALPNFVKIYCTVEPGQKKRRNNNDRRIKSTNTMFSFRAWPLMK